MYDKDNVFAKIIKKEIQTDIIYENEFALSFYDANPMFEKHVLVLPKGEYENILDFTKNASAEEQKAFWNCFVKTSEALGIDANFNIIANAGAEAPFFKQSVFHFHLHLVAGAKNEELKKALADL